MSKHALGRGFPQVWNRHKADAGQKARRIRQERTGARRRIEFGAEITLAAADSRSGPLLPAYRASSTGAAQSWK